ncbi:hypothetical protein [Tissierella sp.]|uniref:hypothetical protein n=1 Tax=Tissierella sp. TaxID=41274 RepID=UPI0028A845BE|nr:hypothetical protein [Tissierella sp.]
MKKKAILIVLLILAISLITGCNRIQEDRQLDEEEVVVKEIEDGKGVKIEYAIEYEEDIFGDLSKEEINEIIDGIFEKVSKNDRYKENTDLAIEEAFKEYGITDENKLEAAKNRIAISLK